MHRLTQEDELELFELLPVRTQQAVARGEVSLADLLERVTKVSESELCPRCALQPVAVRRTGLCIACHKRAMAEAHNEAYRELAATCEYDAAKQRLRRLRRDLGVKAPREKRTQ